MSEHDDQCAIFQWRDMSLGKYPELRLLHASMNAGKRSKRLGAKLRRAGMLAGMPDIILPVARGGYIGLQIEQKVKGGRVRANQEKCHAWLSEEGHLVKVSWSVEDSINILRDYMEHACVRTDALWLARGDGA